MDKESLNKSADNIFTAICPDGENLYKIEYKKGQGLLIPFFYNNSKFRNKGLYSPGISYLLFPEKDFRKAVQEAFGY